jgi:hypothetical protein
VVGSRAVRRIPAVELPGARVELQPQGSSAVTNGQGQFTISGVAPGQYKLSVNSVGFAPFSTDVTVAAGQTAPGCGLAERITERSGDGPRRPPAWRG